MRRLIPKALIVTALAAGCSSGGGGNASPTGPSGPGGDAATTQVAINGDAYLPGGQAVFEPGSITVDPGTTVIWRNNDQTTHTTTADQGQWSSTVAASGSASHQFTASGTYEYHCSLHEYMTGTVVVR